MFKNILFIILCIIVQLFIAPFQIINGLLEKFIEFIFNRMLQFETWLWLDEATYNVVKRKGFKNGYVSYNYDEVIEEENRIKTMKESNV